ncbi:MAG: hypothetical protein J0L53_01740, partial [Spirochaetes bacterium]|nr:hypothetical protein [Spirochaetota bacterium]
MKRIDFHHRLLLAFSGFFLLMSPTMGVKKTKKAAPPAAETETKASDDKKGGASSFQLRPLEVVEPNFFTQNIEVQNAEGAEETTLNLTFTELPHYKDNEFEAKRKRTTVREKWLGRQFLIVMTPNEYKEPREIIKALEPEVYTNAELLEPYDFKKKVFPLKVWLSCIDIGSDRRESAAYESFGERKFAYTYVTHQICLNNLLELDMAFDKERYPDYFISISEREAEALKTNFNDAQVGIVVAWLPDDSGEVKAEAVDWGKFEYNGQLGSETFDRLELKWTAIEVLIR